MELGKLFRKSLRANTNLWLALWALILLNLFSALVFSRGFSLLVFTIILIVGVVGGLYIRYLSLLPEDEDYTEYAFGEEMAGLMDEIRPFCDQVFSRELDRMVGPVIDNIYRDFSRGLEWLWEDADQFIAQVDASTGKIESNLNLVDLLGEEKVRLVGQINERLNSLSVAAEDMRRAREDDFVQLKQFLEQCVAELQTNMVKEKELFYDYVRKLLGQALIEDDTYDIREYFDLEKLGQQFGVIVEKTLETRLLAFQDMIVQELESFSADVVGRMQKNTLRCFNVFQEIKDLLEKLRHDCRGDSGLVQRRLEDSSAQVQELVEKSGDIMVTLAWQEILVEKRWQEIGERLFSVRERVLQSVDEELVKYIGEQLETDIPALADLVRTSENAVFFKSLVDAELIYQLYHDDKLLNVIENGVYSLLQFIRPVEMLVSRFVRFSEEGIKMRKALKQAAKASEHQQIFDRVVEVTNTHNPVLVTYLEGLYPKSFINFCNNPHIKQKPDNMNQAGWALFVQLVDNPQQPEDVYFLVALLLVLHRLRNRYIQPLKSLPIQLEDDRDLNCTRLAVFRSINILLSTPLKGLVRINVK